ncbi:MAG: septum formation initiator family protein [Ktedonobacteraceae bacterium]
MQEQQRRSSSVQTSENRPLVTRAVGLEETTGRLRARRSSLFTQTIILITGLVCFAFLLGSLAQAWSNSMLARQVQEAQQQTQQLQAYHDRLAQQAHYYSDPYVIESEARQDLGYIRAGEHLVVIVGSNQQEQQHTPLSSHPRVTQSFWQQWWNVFFGY